MHPTLQPLLRHLPVVADGAWGTQLQTLGLPPGACADLWNLERPEAAAQVARAYVQAGSRVILTNTFRANRIALADYGLAEKTVQINRAGAEISKRAAGAKALVFASMGPSGKMLLSGEVREEQLAEAFAEQAGALAQGGADGIVIETMSDLTEAKIALAAAKATGLPVAVCMVFDSGPAKDRTMMGISPEQVAEELSAAGADIIGANCGQGIEGFIAICERLRRATALPIWIKPNAGLPELQEGRVVYRTTARQFAARVPALAAAGASFIGGCCGTTPEFIREVVAIYPEKNTLRNSP